MVTGRFETRGSVMLGASLALAAAGLLRVDGVLMSIGSAGLLFLGLARILGTINLTRVGAGVEGPAVACAGVPVRFRLSVRNCRRVVDAFGVEMVLEAPGGLQAECRVPWVPARDVAESEVRVTIPQRGEGESVVCRLGSRFPLGLFHFGRRVEVEHPMRVVPRPVVPVELLAAGSALEATPRASSGPAEAMGEPRGLRGYRSGDPPKAIVWPATLRSQGRGGGVLVREVDPPGFHPRRAVLVFHSLGGGGALIRPDRFERAVSLLWGAIRHFHAMGVPVRLLADFEEWVPRRIATRRQLARAGEMLAGARRAAGTELHELAGRLFEVDRDDAVVVVSDMDPALWQPQLPKRARMVAVDVARYEPGRSSREGRVGA